MICWLALSGIQTAGVKGARAGGAHPSTTRHGGSLHQHRCSEASAQKQHQLRCNSQRDSRYCTSLQDSSIRTYGLLQCISSSHPDLRVTRGMTSQITISMRSAAFDGLMELIWSAQLKYSVAKYFLERSLSFCSHLPSMCSTGDAGIYRSGQRQISQQMFSSSVVCLMVAQLRYHAIAYITFFRTTLMDG